MNHVKKVAFIVATVVGAFFATTIVAKEPATTNPNTVVLNSANTLSLNAEVNGDSVSSIISAARALQTKKTKNDHIYLFLNTPGGSIQAGLELIEALKGIDRPIDTVTLFAASMGFQIAQNLGDRLIVKNGTLMSHRARGEMAGEFGGQSPSQMENRYAFWKSRMQELDQATVDRSNGKQTMVSYQAAYANELWLTGNQAVDNGYADRVVNVKCDNTLAGATTHTVQFLGMNISYDLDNCPINTSPTNIRMQLETTHGLMDSNEFIKQGGKFGPACLIDTNPAKLCLLDTSINVNKIAELKIKFQTQFNANRNKVIYMTFSPNEVY